MYFCHFFSVFPAYAGVILGAFRALADVVSIPRVCGGDPNRTVNFNITVMYSPRMRG